MGWVGCSLLVEGGMLLLPLHCGLIIRRVGCSCGLGLTMMMMCERGLLEVRSFGIHFRRSLDI